MSTPDFLQANAFQQVPVLVTGGLGFMGSLLVERLLDLGAQVTVVDNLHPEGGGRRENVPNHPNLQVIIGSMADEPIMRPLLGKQKIIFGLAAQTSHMGSMAAPLQDFDSNARAYLQLLDWCRHDNPRVRLVYASTRQVYGVPQSLPVREDHPLVPVDVNGVSKQTAENFHLLYHRVYGLAVTVLRFSNVYGPRMRTQDAHQGFFGHWIGCLKAGKSLEVWGGQQRRDFLHVEEAVYAFLAVAQTAATIGGVYNVGGPEPLTLQQLAERLVEISGRGEVRLKPYPAERRSIEIGDIYISSQALEKVTGWRAQGSLQEGLVKTLQSYGLYEKEHR